MRGRWFSLRRSLLVPSALSLLAGVALVCADALAAAGGSGEARALEQIQALLAEKAARAPAQKKLDSQLIYALRRSRNQPMAQGVANLVIGANIRADGKCLVDIRGTVAPPLLQAVEALGGEILNHSARFGEMRAWFPLAQLETLAGRPDVRFIQPAVAGATRAGALVSEGDATHAAGLARTNFLVNGGGVKVGVLSDSLDYLAQSQSTGDLPPVVTVLPGQDGFGAGEGTAMLEIVHDLAPGAQLYFATANTGPAQYAQNILDLRAAGCDVLLDDLFYFNESPFQDGIIAQAVNQVTAAGAWYFSAAGNEGNLTHGTSGCWEGDFSDGGPVGSPVDAKGGRLHSFGGTNYNEVLATGLATVLFWSDPLGASTNDYDLFTVDETGAYVLGSSTTIQNGTQDPYEIVPATYPGARLVIVKAAGAARFLHLDTIRGRLALGTDGNLKGHTAATNAFSVAAAGVSNSFPNPFSGGAMNPVEPNSTDGPRRVFYHANGTAITPGNFSSTGGFVRQKPDIAAADGIRTTVPGFDPFYGTSAATPHAAAIAALLKSYQPGLTAAALRAALTGTALDIEAAGVDRDSGAGIVMAGAALDAISGAVLTNGVVIGSQAQFTLRGRPNTAYAIHATTNLTAWTPLLTNTTAGNGVFQFTDPLAAGRDRRFYRSVRVLP